MKTIGIYHQIDIEVLDEVAEGVANRQPGSQIRASVLALHAIHGVGPATSPRRASPAFKAWLGQSEPTKVATQQYLSANKSGRLALHFAVLFQEYHFFLEVCTQVGSQLRLGDKARQETVRDRLSRIYGQSTNVKQGVQKSLQTLVSWGILRKTSEIGVYRRGVPLSLPQNISETVLASYLTASQRQAIPIADAGRVPAFFWCELSLTSHPTTRLLQAHMEGTGQEFLAIST